MFRAFAIKIILLKIQTFVPQKVFIPKRPFFSSQVGSQCLQLSDTSGKTKSRKVFYVKNCQRWSTSRFHSWSVIVTIMTYQKVIHLMHLCSLL